MAQEQFAGPEYFTEFDPKKFLEQLQQAAAKEETTPDAANPADATEED